LIVQIIQAKELEDSPNAEKNKNDGKKQMKCRYMISDGITSIRAVISQ
jgi:hypothetical protein